MKKTMGKSLSWNILALWRLIYTRDMVLAYSLSHAISIEKISSSRINIASGSNNPFLFSHLCKYHFMWFPTAISVDSTYFIDVHVESSGLVPGQQSMVVVNLGPMLQNFSS